MEGGQLNPGSSAEESGRRRAKIYPTPGGGSNASSEDSPLTSRLSRSRGPHRGAIVIRWARSSWHISVAPGRRGPGTMAGRLLSEASAAHRLPCKQDQERIEGPSRPLRALQAPPGSLQRRHTRRHSAAGRLKAVAVAAPVASAPPGSRPAAGTRAVRILALSNGAPPPFYLPPPQGCVAVELA